MGQLFKGEIININDFNRKIEEVIKKIPLYYDKNKIWYKWNTEEFKWEIIDETEILLNIREETNIANISQNFIATQIINALKIESRKQKPKELRKTQIQFKNKIIDIQTKEEMEATPKYFSFNPIPHKIGKTNNTPTIDHLLIQWVGQENIIKIYEWIAYQLITDYPIHRVIILNGSGSNGKSTLQELMRRFLGKNNYTTGDFENVFVRRFGTSILYRKLSILMPEADFGKLEKTATFKSATGNDPILIEFKNKNHFIFNNYAKATISTNSIPITMDKTDAFYRRIIVIDFPNKFTEKYDILATITEEEYENLAKKCLEILPKLIQKGSFDNEKTLEQKREEYEKLSNPLTTFLEEEIIENGEEAIPKREFLNKANKWLKQKGHRALTNKEISKLLRENYQEGWGQTRDEEGNRKSERVWTGIQWKKNDYLKEIKEEMIKNENI